MRSPRFAYARLASVTDSAVPQRNSRQRSSTRAAVVFKAKASNASWLSSVATRVKALTLEYDSAPDEKADAIAGKVFKACATRTFSLAALTLKSQRQCSQSLQLAKPHFSPVRQKCCKSQVDRCGLKFIDLSNDRAGPLKINPHRPQTHSHSQPADWARSSSSMST